MCGICGVIEPLGGVPDPAILDRMTDIMSHRGPDGRGTYASENAGLGHRRLSIIDIAGGAQPMVNDSGTCAIVYNGEIYNHLDIRRQLEAKDYRYRTRCDTESILHAYEAWGERCVESLVGMFAFAIWDRRTKSLFLARDRLGIKPLYYTIQDGRLIFGSEIKAILAYPGVPREINPRAMRKYFRYLFSSGEETIFKGIHRLPPGTKMTWRDGKASFEKYWDPLTLAERGASVSLATPAASREREAAEKARFLLTEAVRRRLMSDVPLGAFLSGGLDSSAVVAIMSRLVDAPVPTFTIGYSGPDRFFSEIEYAKTVSGHLSTEHHEMTLDASSFDLLPQLVWHLEEPLADSGAVLTYIISKFARQRVTVALTGIGGDEVFGGYRRYLAMKMWRWYNALPSAVRRRVIEPLARRLPESRASKLLDYFRMVRKFVASNSQGAEASYLEMFSAFGQERQRLLFTEPAPPEDADDSEALLAQCKSDDFLAQFMLFDLQTYLPDDLLALADKTSMAVGLEVRVPFLDIDLVQWAQTLPSRFKVRGTRRKYILDAAMRSDLPDVVFNRRKRGFSAPISNWLRGGMRPAMEEALSPSGLGGDALFNRDYLNEIWTAHLSGRQDFSNQLYSLLIFHLWRRLLLKPQP